MQSTWNEFLKKETKQTYYHQLWNFLELEYASKCIYPPKHQVFQAFSLCNYENIKVVILGQDPYHQPNQAHGLAFSVENNQKLPPSLKNIYKEMSMDLHIPIPTSGNLSSWAKQGVFLLNTVLTVEKNKPKSHQKKGWEIFSDHVIQKLNTHPNPLVFILWGKDAQSKKSLITNSKHLILESAHPSPLSAHHGFFNSHPFSKTNEFLMLHYGSTIDWSIK